MLLAQQGMVDTTMLPSALAKARNACLSFWIFWMKGHGGLCLTWVESVRGADFGWTHVWAWPEAMPDGLVQAGNRVYAKASLILSNMPLPSPLAD